MSANHQEGLEARINRAEETLRALRTQIGALHRNLDELEAREEDADEQRATFPVPSERELLDAMLELRAFAAPVSASSIADVIWHGEQLHADIIRIGHRLGMMASVGMVVRHAARRHRANRWSLASAGTPQLELVHEAGGDDHA